MDSKQKKISVLMFPWLAYGHISPFLELAKKLSKRNFHIFFCSTPINLNSKSKLSPKYSQSIQFVEFHLPSSPDLPPHYHTTNGLPPHLMNTLKKTLDMSSLHFSKILETLNPDLLVYDFIQPWAPLLALSNKIPAVHLLCTSAAMSSFSVHAFKKPCEDFPFPNICVHGNFMNAKFNNMMENCSGDDGISDQDRVLQSFERSTKIILVKTFEELEGKFMDYLSVLLNKKIVPTGPLIQDPNEEGDDDERTKMLLEWLNKKSKSSTVFVSFGTIPMHLDQPFNARLVVDVGVGLEVRRNHKNGSLEREEIAKVIKEVVLGDYENGGEVVRRKAREMSNHINKKGEKEMDELVEELMHICEMKPNSCYLS
ncbi:UDP-glucuronosyl/UDP-glucosyltransferase [Corchorus olitorius]|uniref:UDP-glucuronosyl/UDP-glucosyltransferase n=1 Tax=Corchorus olitorius TaxID=93759 RepID=A0A1R3J1L0_9ROSI|nr:UDP-glucuronosyl/UDP-glucosyltransferase [Corchorus olitorius]